MKKIISAILLRACLPTLFALAGVVTGAPKLELKNGDVVAFLGDALMEQEQYHGWIELALTTRFADRDVKFRNLGWNADTPNGASRFGLSLLQAGREPEDEGWKQLQQQIELVKPGVAVVGYGMASSLEGGMAGLEGFRRDYARLLDTISKITPGVRFVLLGPVSHEAGFATPAKIHNGVLRAYADSIAGLAKARAVPYVPLHEGGLTGQRRLTRDGIHLTDEGYRVAAQVIEKSLFGAVGRIAPSRAVAPADPPQERVVVPSFPSGEHGLRIWFPETRAGSERG